ncbi:hypothetical protein HYT56_01125 [Candidatus Woesearchaeota archaeon]|nr:hypothetical protein [Candidatus Woesearchaeota archaeon]
MEKSSPAYLAREISSTFFDRVCAKIMNQFTKYKKSRAVDINQIKKAFDEVGKLIDLYHHYSKNNLKVDVKILINLFEAHKALNEFLQYKRNIESLEARIQDISRSLSEIAYIHSYVYSS